MIAIRISGSEIMATHGQVRPSLLNRLRQLGFTTFEGYVERQDLDVYATELIHFYPTRRDLIFKIFTKWTPPWQERSAIINRRFNL